MEKLMEIEKDLLLEVIAYYMPMDLRHKLMVMLPQAYNKWIGREVMVVNIKPETAVKDLLR